MDTALNNGYDPGGPEEAAKILQMMEGPAQDVLSLWAKQKMPLFLPTTIAVHGEGGGQVGAEEAAEEATSAA